MIVSIDVGRKNLALCGIQPGECRSGKDDLIIDWVVTACEPTSAGIAKCLRSLTWTVSPDVTEVVIERQPHRNPTMTRLQHYLEMYYSMHDKPVTVQDAKHKLSFAASTPWWPPGDLDSWTYHLRKKLSVQTMTRFLGDTPQTDAMKAVFASSKKKDDLADCALQGLAFCHNVRPLELAKRTCAFAVVKPRRPTASQAKTGRYSKPNLAHFFRGCDTLDDFSKVAASDKHIARSTDRQFGSLEKAFETLRRQVTET